MMAWLDFNTKQDVDMTNINIVRDVLDEVKFGLIGAKSQELILNCSNPSNIFM